MTADGGWRTMEELNGCEEITREPIVREFNLLEEEHQQASDTKNNHISKIIAYSTG